MMSARDIAELQYRLYYSASSDSSLGNDSSVKTASLGSDSSDRGETIFFPITRKTQKSNIQSKNSIVPYLNPSDDPIDYIDDILTELRNREVEEKISCQLPTDITKKMYTILTDWLVDVCKKFRLITEVYMNSCYLLRYCLDNKNFSNLKKSNLQLLGCTCLLISSKNENSIEPKDLVFISDKAFTATEIISMEKKVLSTVEFHTRFATPNDFIRIYGRIINSNGNSYSMGRYLSEYCMYNLDLLCEYLPSELGLGCLYLAAVTCSQIDTTWDIVLQISEVNLSKIIIIAQYIYDLITREKIFIAASRKFADSKFQSVSKIPLVRPT